MKNKLLIIYFFIMLFSCDYKEETAVCFQTDDEFAKLECFDIEEFWSNKEKGENIEYFLGDSIFIQESWSIIDNQYEKYSHFRNKNISTYFVYYSTGEILSKKYRSNTPF